jgi:hypothetical protein
MSVGFTAAGLGILIAGSILMLVRRDHLHGSHALWWLAVAGGALAIGFFPQVIDRIGLLFGVQYPPMLLVLLALAAVLLKLLQVDINISRRERRMRRVIQKMAILELELRELREAQVRRPLVPPSSISGQQPAVSTPIPLETASRRKVAG